MSIEITQIRNAVSLNAENTIFDLEINHPEFGWIPYSLHPDDSDNTIDNADLLNLIGSNYSAFSQSDYDAKIAANVRHVRNLKLEQEVDPIVSNPLRWAEMTSEEQTTWSQYRTDLLNVPQQSGFPHDVTFPTKPE